MDSSRFGGFVEVVKTLADDPDTPAGVALALQDLLLLVEESGATQLVWMLVSVRTGFSSRPLAIDCSLGEREIFKGFVFCDLDWGSWTMSVYLS